MVINVTKYRLCLVPLCNGFEATEDASEMAVYRGS
jgi:hypothetical protein